MKKIIYRILFVLTSILFLIIISFYSLINLSKPSNNGTVNISNVFDSVTVIKDQWGIPHIEAKNQHDAIFTYGYTLAKDRLFQMDLQRRLARGELSEILGKDLIKIDKMLRTYGISYHAKQYINDTSKINPLALKYVDAFIEGINYFVKNGPKTIEHRLIGADVRLFDRLDVASMTVYMAFSFMDGIKRDVIYSILKEKINSENLEILFPDYSDNNFLTIQEEIVDSISKRTYFDFKRIDDSIYSNLTSLIDLHDQVSGYNPPFHGSNSWVISSDKSANGNPILANDPHIGLSKPDVWYEAHVSFPGYNNYGYYIPMIPFPLIGHDDIKAWGLTMTENDEVDLYSETFNSEKVDEVLYNNKWVKSYSRSEKIKVKGEKDFEFIVRSTDHGPIISDFLKGYQGPPLAFSWNFYNLENPIFDLLYELNHAKNITQFESSLSKLVSPGLNFSYADTFDNIAWWVAGRFAVRDSNIYAKAILDGNDPNHEIKFYLPFEQNPHLINPESGVIVTANNLPTAKRVGVIPRLDGYYRSADRAHRIYNLLSEKEKWTIEELRSIQTDNFLEYGFYIKGKLLSILKISSSPLSKLEEEGLKYMKNWDGNMKINSIGASIFQFTMYNIIKELLVPSISSDQFKLYMNNPDHWDFFKNLMNREIIPFRNNNNSNFSDLVLAGYKGAISELSKVYGENISKWQWGNIHTIEFSHPLGKVKPLNQIFNLGPYPISGGNNVINKIMSKPGDHSYNVASLPSKRRIIDIKNQENSISVVPSGNSGNFWSTHYSDQVESYINGDYRTINFTKNQYQKKLKNKLNIISKN